MPEGTSFNLNKLVREDIIDDGRRSRPFSKAVLARHPRSLWILRRLRVAVVAIQEGRGLSHRFQALTAEHAAVDVGMGRVCGP